MNRRRFSLAALSIALLLASTSTAVTAVAAPAATLRLIAAQRSVVLTTYGKGPVMLDPAVYVGAVGGPFQVDVTRADYLSPIRATQIVTTGAGTAKVPLPDGLVNTWNGLPWFEVMRVTDAHGTLVASRHLSFCPDTYDQQRVTPDGPANPTFPQFCGTNPFTLGAVWGIDQGWAVNPVTSAPRAPLVKLANGRYSVQVTINPRYVGLFGIAPSDATVTVGLTIKKGRTICRPVCVGGSRHTAAADAPLPHVPTTTVPAPSTEPDLVALPAWGITTSHQRTHDYLNFGATVWDRGPQAMVVEGYRRPGTNMMDGWQYFYDHGVPVGRAPVGTLMYDARPGHEHWHFQQFATYQLLDANKAGIVYSDKTGFCLAPTDAIDLAIKGADYNPGQIGFGGTVCGSAGSLWTRETLPAGWGDTYFQGLPGQSFDITKLPNGRYFIAVQANPGGRLFERNPNNDIRYRLVLLGGRPGARTVKVPPWHGIDTESGGGGVGGGVGGTA
jgi:hypothetical protein